MKYAFTVRVNKPPHQISGHYEFMVAAETAEEAIRKSRAEARRLSGYRMWQCTRVERGGHLL